VRSHVLNKTNQMH